MLTTGIKMIHVPYKGTQPALLDVTGGQVHVMNGKWSTGTSAAS